MIYETLIPQLKEVLDGIEQVKEVLPHPLAANSKLSAYPAAVFYPDSFENAFESTTENRKEYRFTLFVIIGCEADTVANIFSEELPKVVDAVVAALDAQWNAGTINSHRVSITVDSGVWGLAQEQKGIEAFAELTVRFRLLTG